MLQLLLILSLLACVLLVAIVLIQNPKGGGLASNFSASSQLMGVKKTGDFLEKGTWGLAIFIMAMALMINVAAKGSSGSSSGPSKPDRTHDVKPNATQGTPFSPGATGSTGTQQVTPPASQTGTGKKN